MIFIVISIDIRPDKRDDFLVGITRYCAQVRAEPGNMRFTCSEDVEESNQFVVVAITPIRPPGRHTWAPNTRNGFRMAALGGLTGPVDRVPGTARRGLVGDERSTPLNRSISPFTLAR